MIDIIRQKINKTRTIYAVLLLITGTILLGITKLGIIDYISGPKKIDNTENFDMSEHVGEYVEFNAQYMIGVFVEEITKTKKYTITIDEHTTGYGVMCYNDEFKYNGEYQNEFSSGEFYGVLFSKSAYDKNGIESLLDYTNKANYTVKGTITKMNKEDFKYFQQALVDSDSDSYQTGYWVKTEKIKGWDPIWLIILTLGAIVCFILSIYNFVMLVTNGAMKGINSYLKDHPYDSEASLDADFRNASIYAKDHWISEAKTYWISGAKFHIANNKDFIWAYHYYNKNSKNQKSLIMLSDANKKFTKIPVNPAEADQVLKAYDRLCPNIFVGSDPQIDHMFKHNFDGFLRMVKEEEQKKREFMQYNGYSLEQDSNENDSFNNTPANPYTDNSSFNSPVNNSVNIDDPFELNPIDQDPFIQK